LRQRLFLTVVAITVCGAVALTGIAGAREAANTRVTIKAEGLDLSGKVWSPRLHKCAENRLVKVFKQKGDTQSPSTDLKIGEDTSELHGDHGVWSTGNTGKRGKIYARAPRKPGCKPDSSRTILVTP
jgi:hypothetical protein